MNTVRYRILILVASLLCSAGAYTQSIMEMKGIAYRSENEVAALSKYIRVAEKEDTGGYWCIVYLDTLKRAGIITIQRESKDNFTVLELLEIEGPQTGYEMIAGLGELRESEAGYTFVVSIERIPEGDNVALATNKVSKAWAFNNNSKRFEALKARKVTRIGESYMWK